MSITSPVVASAVIVAAAGGSLHRSDKLLCPLCPLVFITPTHPP
jgi:hypothetical protein